MLKRLALGYTAYLFPVAEIPADTEVAAKANKVRRAGPEHYAVGAKAVYTSECALGGTNTNSYPMSATVDSPYTDDTDFLGVVVSFDACREVYSESQPGSYREFDGSYLLACPSDEVFQQEGEEAIPCYSEDDYLVNYMEHGSVQHPYRFGASYVREDGVAIVYESTSLGLYRHGLTETYGVQEYRSAISFSTSTQVGGRTVQSQATYGTVEFPAMRNRVAADEEGFVYLDLDLLNRFTGTGCDLGEFRLRTIEPLYYDEYAEHPVATSGEVEFEQDGQTARARIESDGTLTIVDARGRSTTYSSYEDIRSDLGGCLDHVQ